MTNPNELRLDVIRFKIIAKYYSQIRAIMAEHTGESDTKLKMALKEGHGIEFDFKDDPLIYVVIDTQQEEHLRESGIANPTFLQLFGTSRILDLDRDRAIERFKRLFDTDDTKPKIIQGDE